MFKSPEVIQDSVPGFIANNTTLVEKTVVAKTVPPRKYKGWVYIPETEAKESSSNSEVVIVKTIYQWLVYFDHRQSLVHIYRICKTLKKGQKVREL